jgi:hypothetical protein
MQEIIIVILLVAAIFYIGFRIYKTVTKKKCGDGDNDCGCK